MCVSTPTAATGESVSRRCARSASTSAGSRPAHAAPFKNDRHRSDTLTKHFSWAIRHLVCGETQEAIAGARSQAAVSRAIASIIDLLPDPALADARFRPHVLLLTREPTQVSAD